MKICLNCGDKLLDGAKRCPYCGTKDGKKGMYFPIVDKNNSVEIAKIISSVPNLKSGIPKWKNNLDMKSLSFKGAVNASVQGGIGKAAEENRALQERIRQMDRDGIAYCSKCYSTSLSTEKKDLE